MGIADLTGLVSGAQSLFNLIPNQIDRPDGAPSTAGLWTDTVTTMALGAAAKGMLGEVAKDAVTPALTEILYFAILNHSALSLLNGFSTTEKGTAIEGGQGYYGWARDGLNDAKAGAGTEWEGRAAEDYSSRNTEQYDRVGRMAQADKDLVVILRKQAFEVERLRSDFGGVKTTLNAAIPVAIGIMFSVGMTASYQFQVWVAQACLHTDVLLQSLQGDRAAKNAKELTRIVNEYRAVTQEATTALPYHS